MKDRSKTERMKEAADAIDDLATNLGLEIHATITSKGEATITSEWTEEADSAPTRSRLDGVFSTTGTVNSVEIETVADGLVRKAIWVTVAPNSAVKWVDVSEPGDVPSFMPGDRVIVSISGIGEE